MCSDIIYKKKLKNGNLVRDINVFHDIKDIKLKCADMIVPVSIKL